MTGLASSFGPCSSLGGGSGLEEGSAEVAGLEEGSAEVAGLDHVDGVLNRGSVVLKRMSVVVQSKWFVVVASGSVPWEGCHF
jgi:hypothetical protein